VRRLCPVPLRWLHAAPWVLPRFRDRGLHLVLVFILRRDPPHLPGAHRHRAVTYLPTAPASPHPPWLRATCLPCPDFPATQRRV
jgi:hypothetical protein